MSSFKLRSCIHLAVFLGLLISMATVHATDVYIVAGQSNGYRISSLRAGDTPLPNGRRIYYYGMQCTTEPDKSEFKVLTDLDHRAMGTELALALLEQSDDDIIFIQYCRCGSGVANRTGKGWYPGDNPAEGQTFEGGLYGKFIRYINHAKTSAQQDFDLTWDVKGLFWHQGENDSNGDNHLTYHRNLTNLFWRFRSDLGSDLPIVCGEIRELTDGDRAINRILKTVAEQDELTKLAPAADLKFQPDRDGKPDVHFSLEGCRALCRRLATTHLSLVSGK